MEGKELRHIKSFKKVIRNTTILAISTALATSPINIPYTSAYFTDKISTKVHDVMGIRTLSKNSSGTIELSFDVHRFNNIRTEFDVDFNDNTLIVKISIPDKFGFNEKNIIVDSLELTYEDEIIKIKPIHDEVKGDELVIIFDWEEVADYIDNDDNSPKFNITGKGVGKGISGLGERFVFFGSGGITDINKEFFLQADYPYYIDGKNIIVIPNEGEEHGIYRYKFILDGKDIPTEEIQWELSSNITGVKMKSGKLIVNSNAHEGSIIITAQLISNKYFTEDMEIKLVKEKLLEEDEIPDIKDLNQDDKISEDDVDEIDEEVEEKDKDDADEETENDEILEEELEDEILEDEEYEDEEYETLEEKKEDIEPENTQDEDMENVGSGNDDYEDEYIEDINPKETDKEYRDEEHEEDFDNEDKLLDIPPVIEEEKADDEKIKENSTDDENSDDILHE